MADFNLDGKVSFQGASPDLDANGYFFGVLGHPGNSTFSPNYTVTAPKPW